MIKNIKEIFLEKANLKHNNKYSYGDFDNLKTRESKIDIYCPIHKEWFKQKVKLHLKGCGCPKCGIDRIKKKLSLSDQVFLEKANLKHNNKYSYRNLDGLNNNKVKIDIYCPIHKEWFKQKVSDHLRGCGEKQFKLTQQNDLIKTNYCKENNILLIRISYLDIKKIDNILNKVFNLIN